MGHSYTESKKIATKTISILAVITIAEVIFALTGKGYIINGFHMPHWLVGGVMIVMSVVKAYLIIYEFMHMKYEVPALVKTVLIPTLLLVWAIIAFTYEGSYWQNARSKTHNLKSTATTEQVEHH
ncbi:MAG: cytochrome C oxidase subunit IV family protein [Saprospiraceae bacterium]|nr:cytochrome C oxidase subunit IV family protein [Saprospiraceae bacterium]